MKTFYCASMSTNSNESFSPSASKPRLLLDYLKRRGIYLDIIGDFLPLTEEDLSLAHDPEYVRNVMNLKSSNGFGNKSFEIAESLLFTTGSFYAATEYSVRHKENTFSPTSGFHHVRYFKRSGFCTFNGLMIAALKLKQNGLIKTLGIVDCDQHYCDGTDDIINRQNAGWIKHYSFGNLDVNSKDSDKWLREYPEAIRSFQDVDLIFYQAGADPHIDDPLGGVLTTEQMQTRDFLTFKFFKGLKIPITWNLACGYQNPLERVLQLHETTYKCVIDLS